jgi:hypothetical protein
MSDRQSKAIMASRFSVWASFRAAHLGAPGVNAPSHPLTTAASIRGCGDPSAPRALASIWVPIMAPLGVMEVIDENRLAVDRYPAAENASVSEEELPSTTPETTTEPAANTFT